MSSDEGPHALDEALASYLRSGHWRREVGWLVQTPLGIESGQEEQVDQAVPADRAQPRARAARGGGRNRSEQELLLVALEHLRLEEDIADQVRRAVEREPAVPLIAWPFDLVRELDEALARQVRRLR